MWRHNTFVYSYSWKMVRTKLFFFYELFLYWIPCSDLWGVIFQLLTCLCNNIWISIFINIVAHVKLALKRGQFNKCLYKFNFTMQLIHWVWTWYDFNCKDEKVIEERKVHSNRAAASKEAIKEEKKENDNLKEATEGSDTEKVVPNLGSPRNDGKYYFVPLWC